MNRITLAIRVLVGILLGPPIVMLFRRFRIFSRAKNGCYDCGLPYGGDEWIEAIVPDEVWWQITPSRDGKRGGILCITCIARRCARAGLEDVPVLLSMAPPLRVVTTKRALYVNDSLSVRWYRIYHYWWSTWWRLKMNRLRFIGRIHDSYGDEYD